ncbi:MAG TPA: class I SAM-dependent methyltransferase [Candidatus Krumholzibacteria bacterium]|nr:class I SAM-dependent methyltransferase [Candidatus Krumholzibacteria bacterium]
MILWQDARRLVVARPHGLDADEACAWLLLHRGIEAHPAAGLPVGASGAWALATAPPEPDRLALVSHLLLTDARATAAMPAEFRREDAIAGRVARTLFQRLDDRTVAGRALTAWRAIAAAPDDDQVARHAAAAGLPIVGDAARGGLPWPRLALHAAEVRWPDLSEPVTAPEPASFRAADADALALEAALERRGGWPAAVGDAWRCVHRDELVGLPAAIDVYGSWLSAVWFDEDVDPAAAEAALAPCLDRLAARFGCRGAVLRTHRRNPHRRGLVAEVRVRGDAPPPVFTVTEHGLRYEIDLLRTQHTGLFLDQRDARRLVAMAAADARMANLFSFTCSFSVAAAAAGCEVVFSVDTARACLETGKANFALNGLDAAGRGKFIQEDARRWLARQLRRRDERPAEHRPLDLVVCDPPVFASAEDGGAFAVEQEWPRLARDVAHLLQPDGLAVFANNHRGGDHARYRAQLADAFGVVDELPPPLDFPRLPGAEPHVRIFFCREPRR